MATYKISDHAIDQFRDRHDDAFDLTDEELRHILVVELEKSTPIGAQIGNDALWLMPCGLVAAIRPDGSMLAVKTILTKELAVGNMQAQGIMYALPNAPRHQARTVAPTAKRRILTDDALRSMARAHFNNSVGKRARKAALRQCGADPAGPDGARYRELFDEVRTAAYADRRKAYLDSLKGTPPRPKCPVSDLGLSSAP